MSDCRIVGLSDGLAVLWSYVPRWRGLGGGLKNCLMVLGSCGLAAGMVLCPPLAGVRGWIKRLSECLIV